MHNDNTLVVSPSNVNGLITRLLRQDARLLNLAVRGEITNLRVASSGHCFFSLSDGASKIGASIWKNNFRRLKIDLREGMTVVCRGSISVYEPAGTYGIVCSEIDEQGDGEQSAALDELVKKLKAEGIFERKRPLPEFPKTIAVVTSPTGAVVHDIEKTLENRFPCVKMIVVPTVVQGENAPESIARGIEYAQTVGADVIIFGRGGGAAEDLGAFNAEVVARAVFNSKIPTISAVGHEIDITIADLAADKTAATPTAAAVAAVPDKEEIEKRLRAVSASLSDKLRGNLLRKQTELCGVKERICGLIAQRFKTSESELFHLNQSIKGAVEKKIELAQAALEKNKELVLALDPLSTLKRGYSIVTKDGRTVTDARELSVGERVEIRFENTGAVAEIKEVKNGI